MDALGPAVNWAKGEYGGCLKMENYIDIQNNNRKARCGHIIKNLGTQKESWVKGGCLNVITVLYCLQ